ncbi:MAG TPA: hypothetical protein VK571_00955 [Gemmatimonadaceae bacterium]|nr:hypothetical protein [Gemmatimonadaceae bacterium]
MKIEWESVQHDHLGYIYRTRTPNGWLVRHFIESCIGGGEPVIAMAEVTDPKHEWLSEEHVL